jgi:hypothetical protein
MFTGGFIRGGDILPAGDTRGIENMAQYIARCPISMARMVEATSDGGVIYKTDRSEWIVFDGNTRLRRPCRKGEST